MALYNIASPSGGEKRMARFITDELRRMGIPYRKDRYGNIYAVKGNRRSYPCVVAHMDEVHRRKTGTYAAHLVAESMIVGYDHKHRRMTGIGADDKNCIWICLKCLESFKAMKCAFFVQEENGCIGSRKADMDFFADCRFVIGCDRRGNSDIITRVHGTELCSEEFLETVSPGRYGYHPASGLSTDVHTLKTRGAVRILHKPLLRLLRTSYEQGIYHLGGLVQVLPLRPAHCLLPQERQSPQGKNR